MTKDEVSEVVSVLIQDPTIAPLWDRVAAFRYGEPGELPSLCAKLWKAVVCRCQEGFVEKSVPGYATGGRFYPSFDTAMDVATACVKAAHRERGTKMKTAYREAN